MSRRIRVAAALLAGVAIVGGAWLLRDRWRPHAAAPADAATSGKHADHDHAHGDAAMSSVTISEQAAKNLGLKTAEVVLTDYWRSLSFPAIVAEQPGHSERRLTAVVQGVVHRVFAVPGQAVRTGDPLFEIQLTGEALVSAQSNLLRTIKDIELVDAELKRIAPLVPALVTEKTQLEREYERKRLHSQREVQVQELLIRGLSQAQIDGIASTGKLLRQLVIRAPLDLAAPPELELTSGLRAVDRSQPRRPDSPAPSAADIVFTVEKVNVFPGKYVQPGEELCDLAEHSKLTIEAAAFEAETGPLAKAIEGRWPVRAVFESVEPTPVMRERLHILYVDNVVDPGSRTVRFFVPIENEVVRDNRAPDGIVYRTWRFKPGQRLRVEVPVDHWTERIVVPLEAVVREGPDAFVFRANGKQMERVPVHVEYQDGRAAVIANDGSLFPGDVIAINNAYQLNLALKKAAGSGADPHAGHNH